MPFSTRVCGAGSDSPHEVGRTPFVVAPHDQLDRTMQMTTITPASTAPARRQISFGMRMKLLVAFSVAFSVIFAALTWLIIAFVTNAAETKLVSELQQTAKGGAQTLDAVALQRLLAQYPEADPANPFLSDSPLYREMNEQLMRIRTVVPNASPYTYFKDPADGKLHWLTTWSGLDPDPNFTVQYRTGVADVVGGESSVTYRSMLQGLDGSVSQPPYYDSNGGWISNYTPIRAADGTVVAAIGIDYPLSYVSEVRTAAIRVVGPLLIASYLLLLLLVLLVSTWLTRPLQRLTLATRRIADGEYDVELGSVITSRFKDEMVQLAGSFEVMVNKVRAREKNLTQQVTRLKVEIDAKKKEAAVAEIIESDFFTGIAEKANIMRSRIKALDADGDGLVAPA